jgi:integrase/recombinase XerD
MARVTPHIGSAIEDYVRLRRQLGFLDEELGPQLRRFATFLERRGAAHITVALAVEWARMSPSSDARCAMRLSWVRNLARHLSAIDPRNEIPPPTLLPASYQRGQPYLYTDEEVRALMEAARRLPSPTGLRPAVYTTLIGLIAVTGLRSGEAIALDDHDVDRTEGVLTIRRTKFMKARLVTLHPTSVRALDRYVLLRDKLLPRRHSPALFVGELGGRLGHPRVHVVFRRLCMRAGVTCATTGPRRRQPRLHDFRHRLAVNTLVRWQRHGTNVDAELPVLSTFLGHRSVTDTYWYLTATPELLRVAAERNQKVSR